MPAVAADTPLNRRDIMFDPPLIHQTVCQRQAFLDDDSFSLSLTTHFEHLLSLLCSTP